MLGANAILSVAADRDKIGSAGTNVIIAQAVQGQSAADVWIMISQPDAARREYD
jgi:hypothetical protein